MSFEVVGEKPHRAILFGGSLVGIEMENRMVEVKSVLQGGAYGIVKDGSYYYVIDTDLNKRIFGPFSSAEIAEKQIQKQIEKEQRSIRDKTYVAEPKKGPAIKNALMKEALEEALNMDDQYFSSNVGLQLPPSIMSETPMTRSSTIVNVALEERKQAIMNALQAESSVDRFFSQAANEAATETIKVQGTNTIPKQTYVSNSNANFTTVGLNNTLEEDEE